MSKRSGVEINTKVYGSFKGVDFNTDPSMVDDQRTPLSVNMVSDDGGNPEKRCGYEYLANLTGGKILGIFPYSFDNNSKITPSITVDGSSVTNEIKVDATKFCEKVGTYGSVTITINWTVHAETSDYVITVTCGTYTDTEEAESESIVKRVLYEYGITNLPSLGDENTLTFNIPKKYSVSKHIIVQSGAYFYRMYKDGSNEYLYMMSGYVTKKSTAVFLNKNLYIFTGVKLLVYDGDTISTAESNAYIPLTVIGKVPGSTPGGVTYEGVNYLTGNQKNSFKADGTTNDYHIPYTDATNIKVWVNDEEKTAITDYGYLNGVVTFVTPPPAPAAGAEDNVVIQFNHTVSGYADRINKLTTAIAWGVNGASDRIVATGDDSYPNRDYICGFLNGFYWSDIDYNIVGTDFTKIIGYRRIGESLAIIKEDNGQDTSVFLRTSSLSDDGDAMWSTKPCLSGVGGVSEKGFGNINDDQLVLTSNGVYAITTNSITAEKIAEVRSKYINPKLKKESLYEAYCCSARNMFFTFFPNGHVYVLDGRQAKSYSSRNETTFNYEGFYWELHDDVCSVMMDENNGVEDIYFGNATGKVFRFMFDEERMIRYSDGGYFNNNVWVNGSSISSVWTTPSDDDGDPMILKTMLKKGNAVTLKPFPRSSAKVCIRTDKDAIDWQANIGYMDIFDWENIDFSRFGFDSNDAPREIVFNRKVKKYKRLQIIIRNNEVNEGFGVYKIVKHFVTGNFAKK